VVRSRTRRATTLSTLAISILVFSACAGGGGGSAAPSAAAPSAGASGAAGDVYQLHMRMTPSNAAWVVAQDEGLFDRINLEYELVGYGESAQLFLAGEDPVGQESPWEAARFQSEGEDISYFGTPSALNFYSGLIIQSANKETYKTLTDLKGKKLGHPGFGTGTWQAFEIIAKANYGMDARTDFVPVEADPGALLGLLQTGEIDATINFTGQTATSLTRPEFAVILNFSEEWQKSHGQPLVINGPMARRSWLDENTDVARRLVAGVDAGLQWMKDHPEEFRKGGKYANIVEGEGWFADDATTDKVHELLQEGTWYLKADQFTQEWVDSVYEFISQGKGVFADEIPPKDKVFYLPLLQD
jgi:ABC-type nitrate/sulfonate/bicarbonate transport system substrate-binding protein